ncbi:uncharacterized protein [Triticum aestivum]|uniref:DUF6598 domain-containing protein n=5 Tax=Triticinae TaxID=1648030 RepID=A0A3B6JP58_WHEAT|nr:uncharacterized protein LOC123098942 [Triticum aestivum]
MSTKSGTLPLLRSRVATFGASIETAPPLPRSRVASVAEFSPNKENRRRTNSCSTQAATSPTAVPPHQSKVAICGSGATIQEKTRSKSCSTQAAASSTAPPFHQSRVHMSVSGVPNKQKRRTKSHSTQADASSMDPPLHQSRVPMSVSGVSVEEKRRTKSLMPKPPRRSKVALTTNGRPVDGVRRADVIEYYKHSDGSIYRQTDFLSKLYRVHDTNETELEPMMRSEPSDGCSLNWRPCERHADCTMMQIFSLKLAYPPAGDQVKVYGFMAVRDTRDHLRNYIFNRTRDDPFIVEQEDGFIQLSGPKRGIWWYDKQLVEFDMRIKRGENEADDLQLIDGAVWFYDGCSPHARVLTQRIDGDYGSVDISYALLQMAMEATVQIAVSELDRDIGLLVRAFYVSDLLHQGM